MDRKCKNNGVHSVILNHKHGQTCRAVAVQTDTEHPHLTTLPGQQAYEVEWAVKKGIKPSCDWVWALCSVN